MSTAPGDTGRRTPVLVVAVLLALSVVAALVYGGLWAFAANDDSVSKAVERDDALQAGRQAIVNFNSLDHHDLKQGLDRWESSSTGPLHDEVVKSRGTREGQIAKAKTKTDAQVLDAGIAEFDQAAGKARMIAVATVTVTPDGKPPSQTRTRYQAELTRENGEWKLSALGPVPVG